MILLKLWVAAMVLAIGVIFIHGSPFMMGSLVALAIFHVIITTLDGG